jgi:hypothetical protein
MQIGIQPVLKPGMASNTTTVDFHPILTHFNSILYVYNMRAQ